MRKSQYGTGRKGVAPKTSFNGLKLTPSTGIEARYITSLNTLDDSKGTQVRDRGTCEWKDVRK